MHTPTLFSCRLLLRGALPALVAAGTLGSCSPITTYPLGDGGAKRALRDGGMVYNLGRADHRLVLMRDRTTYLPSPLLARICQAGRYAALQDMARDYGVIHPMLDQGFADKGARAGSLTGLSLEQAQSRLIHTQYMLAEAKVVTRFMADPNRYFVVRYRGKGTPPDVGIPGRPGDGDPMDKISMPVPGGRPTPGASFLTPMGQALADLGKSKAVYFNMSTEPSAGAGDALSAAKQIMATIRDLDKQIDEARAKAVAASSTEVARPVIAPTSESIELRRVNDPLKVVPALEKERGELLAYLFGTVAVVDDEVDIPMCQPTDSQVTCGRTFQWMRLPYDPSTGTVAMTSVIDVLPTSNKVNSSAETELIITMQVEAPPAKLVQDANADLNDKVDGLYYRIPANALVTVIQHHKPSGEKLMLYQGNHSIPELGFVGILPEDLFEEKAHMKVRLREDGSADVSKQLHIPTAAIVGAGLLAKKAVKNLTEQPKVKVIQQAAAAE